jgi:tRNA nucleotidyltransferase/poly(A) polymerase
MLLLSISLMLLSAGSSLRVGVNRSFMKRRHSFMHCLRNTESLPTPVECKSIILLPEEEQVVKMLNDVVREYKLKTQIRIAGGWVRDRLLGLSGKYDIDIAIDNMTGCKFCTHLAKWNSENGLEYVKFTVIQQNPSKSKHLETGIYLNLCRLIFIKFELCFSVTAKIGPFSVDFVNLRTETYQQNSRIPTAAFGTPLEDALRRDLTINSLFYNIHSGKVEDFTNMGIHDIQHKIIRTPLPALVTLTDDPLRCLRAIRFACRLGFDFDQELASAVSQPVVLDALEVKISKERVLTELELMFELLSAVRAVVFLHQFKLLPFVLTMSEYVIQANKSARLLPAVPLSSYSHASLAAVLIVDRFCRHQEIAPTMSDANFESVVKEINQPGEVRKIFM